MSPSASATSESLFGHTRSAVLSMLYGHAGQAFYLRQLVRAVGTGHGAIQRELKRLTDMGLIVRRSQGNQVLFQANTQSPIFPEIKSLITKTVGIHDVIRSSLASLGTEIRIAFIYGSVARQQERANSDVDLMVLGDAPFGEVVSCKVGFKTAGWFNIQAALMRSRTCWRFRTGISLPVR